MSPPERSWRSFLRGWRKPLNMRRLLQAVFFFLFVFLLLRTEYRGSPEIRYPVNAFFQIDPYLGLAAGLAARAVETLFWPALITLGVTLILGRVFCGWICPLGSLLDFAGRLRHGREAAPASATGNFGKGRGRPFPKSPPLGRSRFWKYSLLAAALSAAAAGFQGAWLLDPFSILGRAFAVSVIPAANLGLNSFFDAAYRHARPLSDALEPLYGFLQRHVLTFDQQLFRWGMASLALLAGILFLETIRPRFWCRHLCPLGALFSLTARVSLMRRRVSERCTDCGACYGRCSLGLIDEANHRSASAECTTCLVCREVCPRRAIDFPLAFPLRAQAIPDLSRRRLLGGALAGVLAVPLFRVSPASRLVPSDRLRPPGSLPEREFLARCVRCGSCMKVCMGNAIHPALLEAGPEGLMTPVMYFRAGQCEYNCTLCGQVCPTRAIRRLTVEEKHRFKIGEAYFDRDRCLPWASFTNCMVCEEHCPVLDKAIRFEEVTVPDAQGRLVALKRPQVVPELCIGCGICETKCPLPGRSAVIVAPVGETRSERR